MGTTVDQIGNLSEFAKEMGATTQFSATEAAEAMNYLALAGYDAEKQIAALPTVLNLAAAGDMDLAYASDLVTDSMAALGLSMNQLENYSDQMAKTAQKSNTSVAQLGEAILVCGGQAKMAGMDTTLMTPRSASLPITVSKAAKRHSPTQRSQEPVSRRQPKLKRP
jgi:TP901 family phage tail tape measure protein